MADTSSSSSDRKIRVYVWDMDETLILLKSLLNGTYANAFGSKDVRKGEEIGKMWETLILDLCDEHFFYEQIENFNEPYLDALNQFDDGRDLSDYEFHKDGFSPPKDESNKRKLAYRLRAIAASYEQGLERIFDQQTKEHWNELYEMTDKYTDGWLSSARCFLEQCSSNPGINSGNGSESINVLVTSGSLVPSIAKCLLFRLDSLIKHENVYSSWEVGKVQCFQWIKKRFDDPTFQFCVIGDGREECEAAEAMKWPFVQIDMRPSSSNRFPGLTLRTVGYYFSVIYGNQDTPAEQED